MESVLTIGEVARRSGVATSALRFYEERGLIASERAGSGHRRYPRSVLRRIAFIVFAQRIGLTLEEIGVELAKLPTDRIPERADWAKLSGTWTRRIDARIAELQRLRDGPDRMHRLRLPVDRPLPARATPPTGREAPGRGRGSGWADGSAILDDAQIGGGDQAARSAPNRMRREPSGICRMVSSVVSTVRISAPTMVPV